MGMEMDKMNNKYDILQQYKNELNKLQKDGTIEQSKIGESLYWSGKMAILLNSLLCASLQASCTYIPLLKLVLNEYNNTIMELTIENKRNKNVDI